jgi:hypothetical protein
MRLGDKEYKILMVGIVGVVRSKWNKLPIFMAYNPFLQSNGITPKTDPF